MSFLSEHDRKIILDLMRNRISEDAFFEEFPTAGSGSAMGLAMLNRALLEKDPVGVEFGLYLGFRFGISPDYLAPLLGLAEGEWHQRHEDVVLALEKLLDPSSIDVLSRVACTTYDYLAYDGSRALRVKSVYAISKIPALEAVAALKRLWQCGDDVTAPLAKERLAALEKRSSSEAVRDAARRTLNDTGI